MDDAIESYAFSVRELRTIIGNTGVSDVSDVVPLLEMLARNAVEKRRAQEEAEARRQEEHIQNQELRGI